jgi:hypothetical protein
MDQYTDTKEQLAARAELRKTQIAKGAYILYHDLPVESVLPPPMPSARDLFIQSLEQMKAAARN